MENVKNDAICHVTRQNQYNPAGGGATINTPYPIVRYQYFNQSAHTNLAVTVTTFNAAIFSVLAILFLLRYDLLKYKSKWHCLHLHNNLEEVLLAIPLRYWRNKFFGGHAS